YKDRKQSQTPYTLPSVAMRNGDFSALLASGAGAFNPQTGQGANVIVDPNQCSTAGGVRVCQPFAGNIIPKARFDPIAQKLLEFYPEPNTTGTGTLGVTNDYLSLQNRVIDKNQYT